MGNFKIEIHGVGPHENESHEGDADRLARSFVDSLTAAGHRVDAADFHGASGRKQSLLAEGVRARAPVTSGEEPPPDPTDASAR